MYKYDDEEWENVVARDPEWDRAETDYLLSLCEQYDLRFLVIADRYEVRTPTKPQMPACTCAAVRLLITCHDLT